MSVCGGLTGSKPATDEIQGIVDSVKEQIASQSSGKNLGNLKAVSYKSQVVAGTNYIIKVNHGEGHSHVKVHKALPHEGGKLEVLGVQHGKSHEDEIDFF